MTRIYRQLDRLRELSEQTNDETDEIASRKLAALAQNVYVSGDIVEFAQTQGEAVLLTAGTYPGFEVNCTHALVRGLPGAIINGLVRVTSTCTLENLHFKSTGEESNALRLVQVESGGIAIIRNCTFERKYDDQSSNSSALGYAHLAVLLGGNARAMNCTFTSSDATGAMDGVGFYAWNEPGNPAANLHILASYNPTTHTLDNGTATSVIT